MIIIRPAILVAALLPAAAFAEPRVQILDAAVYGASELRGEVPDDGWLVLCAERGAARLRRAQVKVVPVDGDGGPQRDVQVAGCAAPRLLVRGLDGKEGDVPTARVKSAGRGAAVIDFRGQRAKLHFIDETRSRTLVLDGKAGRVPLSVVRADASEDAVPPPKGWRVRWAGDLDGDGQLDLVTEERIPIVGVMLVQLFLSTARDPAKPRPTASTSWAPTISAARP